MGQIISVKLKTVLFMNYLFFLVIFVKQYFQHFFSMYYKRLSASVYLKSFLLFDKLKFFTFFLKLFIAWKFFVCLGLENV